MGRNSVNGVRRPALHVTVHHILEAPTNNLDLENRYDNQRKPVEMLY